MTSPFLWFYQIKPGTNSRFLVKYFYYPRFFASTCGTTFNETSYFHPPIKKCYYMYACRYFFFKKNLQNLRYKHALSILKLYNYVNLYFPCCHASVLLYVYMFTDPLRITLIVYVIKLSIYLSMHYTCMINLHLCNLLEIDPFDRLILIDFAC